MQSIRNYRERIDFGFKSGLGLLAVVAVALLLWPTHLAADPPRKLSIVSSILPLYCFAANIAGEAARVENLIPPGVSPHDYDFAPSDLRKLQQADLIVLNGLELEHWLPKTIRLGITNTQNKIVEAAAGLSGELISDPGDRKRNQGGQFRTNPHIWLDPHLALHMVTNILHAMQRADPVHADLFTRNASTFAFRLQKLDLDLLVGLGAYTNAAIVSHHEAFPYFARRYGLEIIGVIETTPEIEPSPRHLHELADLVRKRNAKVLFTEAQSPSRLARQFAADLNLSLAPLDTLETGALTLTAYEDRMRTNLEVLRRALR